MEGLQLKPIVGCSVRYFVDGLPNPGDSGHAGFWPTYRDRERRTAWHGKGQPALKLAVFSALDGNEQH